VIVKDRNANYGFRRGTDKENAFFLGPHEELVTLRWSTGIHKEKRDLSLTRFDIRPKFMWYESETRTKDNVELILGITIFWQIVDMEAMILTTDDTPGDICSHARSTIIQAVSRVPLDKFLATFNSLVRDSVLASEDEFYGHRGVKIHEVEVRSVSCKQPETQQILQEIIQEATDRLNRLQKQESENEVQIKKVEGEIESERTREQLLVIKEQHLKHEGAMEGRAQAERLRAFFEGLGSEFDLEQKLHLFATLKKNEALGLLSEGNANLYFTPADVDLSIEARPPTARRRE